MKSRGLATTPERAALVSVRARAGQVALLGATLADLEGDEDGTSAAAALAGAGASRGAIRLGVPGREAIIRYLQLPLVPDWRLKLLMADEVEEVAEKAGEALSADYQLLPIPEDVQGPQAGELSALVALAKEPPLADRIRALEGLGYGVESVTPLCIALFNAWTGLGHTDPEPTLLVDASPAGTEVVLTRDGILLYARSLPPARAGDGELPDERAATELARAVANTAQLAEAQQKIRRLKAASVRLSGAYAAAPALVQALEAQVRAPVEVFDPLERLDAGALSASERDEVAGRGPELALALGLALGGTHPRTVDLDLLPAQLKERREFKTRTVWLYVGVAAAVLAAVAQLGAAWALSSDVKERGGDLVKLERGLESRKSALDALRAANRSAIDTLNGLTERTRPGDAVLALLSSLREATPPKVTVTELRMRRAGTDDARAAGEAFADEGEPDAATIEFAIRGEVDDAGGDALAQLGRFEAALRADPRIGFAKVTGTPTPRPGATLGFALTVRVRVGGAGEGAL